MSKYIIDLRPDCKVVQQICASNENVNVGARSVGLLDALTDEYVKENFKDLLEGEYQRGLEEGKAQAERGCKGCEYEGKTGEHLPCEYCKNNFRSQWTAKADKIEVGDEVKHKSEGVTWTAIVTRIRCGTLTLMGHSGASADNYPIEDFVKTGRHFDIQSILEAMKHD